MSKLITFHRIFAGCEEGRREAWRAFLTDYTPIVFQLVGVYLPLSESREEFWADSLQELSRNNCQRLRAFDHQAEREFLCDLRVFLLERGAARLDPSKDAREPARPTSERVSGLLNGLPLAHREIVWVKMAGYSNPSIERLFRITPAIAQQGLERLRANYSLLLDRPDDGCLWPVAWAEVTRAARAAKTADCPALRQFVRVLDGQSGWYDKEPVEDHISHCLHCLESWVALREIVYWRRQAKALRRAEADTLLSSLTLQPDIQPRRSVLQRIFR